MTTISTTHVDIATCLRLTKNVTRLGGTIPAEIRLILDTLDAILKWAPRSATEILSSALQNGELTPDNAGQVLTKALLESGSTEEAREMRGLATGRLTRTFVENLYGPAGDELIGSLTPVFDEAVLGIVTAAEHFGPDTDAEHVLELGDDAAAAWRMLGKHQQILDDIQQNVIHPLVDVSGFNVLGGRNFLQYQIGKDAAFYVTEPRDSFDALAKVVGGPVVKARGGRWFALATKTGLTLNTISRANEILDVYESADTEQTQRNYLASHPDTAPTGEAA